jgi:internalin A
MFPKPRSWRPRFSLRTLVIFMTLVAIVSGWISQSVLRQRRAVAELTKLGADVLYEHRVDPQSTYSYPQWLRDGLGVDFFAEATEVRFGFTYGWADPELQNGMSKARVMFSQQSQRQINRRGLPVQVAPTPQAIEADAMANLRGLPHLRRLTLVASLNSQAPGPITGFASDHFVLDAKSLQILRNSPTLEELDLSAMPASDELLAGLRGFQKLKRLRLGSTEFTEQGARDLGSLSALEELTFKAPGPLPDNLPVLSNLRELHIPGGTIVTQTARCFQRFPKLQTIECGGINVDDEGIRYLAPLHELRELNLFDSKITDAGAEHLGKLTELRSLILTNNPITDNGLRHLSQLTKLERLYLPHLPITDIGLSYLRPATAMRELLLQGTKITDAGLLHLSGMTELHSLDLSFTEITDKSVDQLLGFKKLVHLRLHGTKITRQGASRLRQVFPAATDP